MREERDARLSIHHALLAALLGCLHTAISIFLARGPRHATPAACACVFILRARVAAGRAVADADLLASVRLELAAFAAAPLPPGAAGRVALLETAGGVASPGPGAALQCDLLRPLRLPGVLAGDGRLGGISATLAAYESLAARGYDVPAVALMEPPGGLLGNAAALRRYLDPSTAVLAFPECAPPPEGGRGGGGGGAAAPGGGGIDASLAAWLRGTRGQFDELLQLVRTHHAARLGALRAAAGEAREALWWPFTQHGALGGGGGGAAEVTVIDARSGEHLSVFREGGGGGGEEGGGGDGGPALQQQYDGCASWWTQVRGAAGGRAAAAAY
jgi:dethiobiotin synthetase/adenosylmethionine--8-amino-7-oxononanoate aminotransferase